MFSKKELKNIQEPHIQNKLLPARNAIEVYNSFVLSKNLENSQGSDRYLDSWKQ